MKSLLQSLTKLQRVITPHIFCNRQTNHTYRYMYMYILPGLEWIQGHPMSWPQPSDTLRNGLDAPPNNHTSAWGWNLSVLPILALVPIWVPCRKSGRCVVALFEWPWMPQVGQIIYCKRGNIHGTLIFADFAVFQQARIQKPTKIFAIFCMHIFDT